MPILEIIRLNGLHLHRFQKILQHGPYLFILIFDVEHERSLKLIVLLKHTHQHVDITGWWLQCQPFLYLGLVVFVENLRLEVNERILYYKVAIVKTFVIFGQSCLQ